MAKSPKRTYTRSRKNIAPLHSNTYMQTQPSLPHNNTFTTLLILIGYMWYYRMVSIMGQAAKCFSISPQKFFLCQYAAYFGRYSLL